MATGLLALGLLFFFAMAVAAHLPYRSPATFFADHNRMLSDLKIFVYDQSKHPPASPLELLFHTHLLRSSFLTSDPDLAHLFYLSFPGRRPSARSITSSIRRLRHELPYWNRSLGADHFYLLCGGLGPDSHRNLVELRKNAVQVSCFPPAAGKFIPHKDISLPPPVRPGLPPAPADAASRHRRYLGYYFGDAGENASFLDELRKDPSFLVDSAGSASPPGELAEKLLSSRFCLFFSGAGLFAVGEALRYGCVPAVVADGPVAGLPFSDVLRWGEVAVFVRVAAAAAEVKQALEVVVGAGERYAGLRERGMRASVHFDWDVSVDGYDAFRTVMYQLWKRRHVIRYGLWKLDNVDHGVD